MNMEGYWEAANGHAPHPVKFESEASVAGYTYCNEPGLNFSTNSTNYSEDDADFAPGRRGKTSRQDPLSHRIIEKRRRDRMNSCLADLSRLIPQQYMRKGRGRVEKTEIIEMAIRHLKNLQSQESITRDTTCAEQYRIGYHDCLTEAAKFMLRERGEEMCYRMVTHLKDHCNEIMKGDFFKTRVNGVEHTNGTTQTYLQSAPISQLREMLVHPTSEVDNNTNSNDNLDVKDLSFRSNNPPQAPVITSTAPNAHHHDNSSNQSSRDFESSSPSRISTTNQHLHQDNNNNINQHESVLRTIRMRKFSETSPDHENSHSYKFKNYIQQRFSQDIHENGHIVDVESHGSPLSNHNSTDDHSDTSKTTNHSASTHSRKESPQTLKRKSEISQDEDCRPQKNNSMPLTAEVKSEALTPTRDQRLNALTIPIFACHTQGFYVPLNIDYEALLPYLQGIDLLTTIKGLGTMPPLHPININVNYAPAFLKTIRNVVNGKTSVY